MPPSARPRPRRCARGRQDGRILAVGFLDGPELLRLAIAPEALRDEELARRLADDAARPERGVLVGGEAYVEAPVGASSNVGAVATYESAGFHRLGERRDRRRDTSRPGR